MSDETVRLISLTDFLQDRLHEDAAWVVSAECRCPRAITLPDCPDRLASDVEAKEKILNMWRLAPPAADAWLTPVVEWLVEAYADHPDYDPTWRPS